MTSNQNLIDYLEQLSQEIADGEILIASMRHDKRQRVDVAEVEAEVAHLRRHHRTLLLRGYYEVTGSPAPDASEPDYTVRVRTSLRRRLEGADA